MLLATCHVIVHLSLIQGVIEAIVVVVIVVYLVEAVLNPDQIFVQGGQAA